MFRKHLHSTTLTIILTLSLIVTSFGQSADTIFNKIKDLSPKEQVLKLNKECWKFRSTNPEYAFQVGSKAIQLSDKHDYPEMKTELYNMLGVVYRNIGKLDSSYLFYDKALTLAIEFNDSTQIAYSYNNIGGYYRLKGLYTEAIDNMLKALRIFERLGDSRGAGFCAINIGILFRRQGDYDKAFEYLERTIAIREKLNDKHGIALAKNQIAEIYYYLGDNENALSTYKELLNIYNELDEIKGIAAVNAGIAGVYFSQGKYDLALKYREVAIKLDKQINNKYGIITNLKNIGRIYKEFGDVKSAEKYLQEALSLVKESGFQDLEVDIYFYLSELYKSINNNSKAYNNLKLYVDLKEKLFNEEKTEIINELQTAYDTEQKELENNLLRHELEYEKDLGDLWTTIAVLTFILFVVIWQKWRSNKKANILLNELNTTKDKYFRILAHDLKNPFNTILGYSEILSEDFHEIEDDEKLKIIQDINHSTQKLSSLLMNLLTWAQSQSGTMKVQREKFCLFEPVTEVVNLFSYAANDKNILVNVEISKEDQILFDPNMFKFVVRNLVNNAIKYTREGGSVRIRSVKEKDSAIVLAIEDDGVGIKESEHENLFTLEKVQTTKGTSNESGSGLGLVIVKEFVEKNNGEIWFESTEEKGTTFYVRIPA